VSNVATTPVAPLSSELWASAAVGGAQAAAGSLHTAVAEDRLSHAWLLVGPDGVGQRELAIALAATLNCIARDAPRPCGICDACARTRREVHPALLAFEPDGANHRVEDVRGPWTEAAMRTTPEARRKVLRIVAVDRMNVAAQNAFLKLLEEPPASVVCILEAEDPGRLPGWPSRWPSGLRVSLVVSPHQAISASGTITSALGKAAAPSAFSRPFT
jgi:DNA polymerase III gamma/tau subunit